MSSFSSVLTEVRKVLGEVTGEAGRVAKAGLADLEAEAAKVQSTVGDLLTKARADAEAAVSAAEPEVKAAVSAVVAQLELDVKAALAALATHGL